MTLGGRGEGVTLGGRKEGVGIGSIGGVSLTGGGSSFGSVSESISMSPTTVMSVLLVGSEVAVCWALSNTSTFSVSFLLSVSRCV